ncbi:MAG: right-handed parallel beta-helix repeat-containing protein [Nostoc sp.]|uniref:beta strand repeat-containing protein n=1 Tax=Nostoc sp. TaxID=1180 RepID=UPI002FFA71EC
MAIFTVTNTNNSGAGSLRQEILDANALSGKDIINFGGLFHDGLAHTISLTGSSLSITDDITIQGKNPNLLTISDKSASRVFDVATGATATINGLTITNSYNAVGGGGGISNEGVLTLNNSIITGNTVTNNTKDINGNIISAGGGIYNTGTLVVNQSTISNNLATYGEIYLGKAGVFPTNFGGGIYNSGSLITNYSTISGNTEIQTGADRNNEGIYNIGTATVNYSTVSGYNGSDIVNDITSPSMTGSLTVNYSTITGSTSTHYDTIGSGGITNYGDATVNYSTISGNDSGIIMSRNSRNLSSVATNLTVNYSTVTDNINDGIRIFYGSVSVNNSIISYNSKAGITLDDEGKLIVNSSTISHNHSSGISIVSFGYSPITVNNSIISNNSTAGSGGGIYNGLNFALTGGSITVNNSIISGNTAGIAGGGIYSSGNITLNNTTITGNSAVKGGGIYNDGTYDGFPIFRAIGGTVSVNSSTISDNTATTGGGIYNNDTLSVSDSTISNNYASEYGGGIYNSSFDGTGSISQLSNVTVSYSSISGNTAGTAGGGIYNDKDINFGETISVHGAGTSVYSYTVNQLGVVTVSDSTIADNQAHFGGGIYNDGTLTVGNSTIKHNKAFGIELSSGGYESGDGGGIYNNSTYGTTTVDYSAIACNFDTCQEDSNNRISRDDIAGKFINNGYNWIGINIATTAAGDAA